MYGLVMNVHDYYSYNPACETHFYGTFETHEDAREHMNELVNAHMADWVQEADQNEERNSTCKATLGFSCARLTDEDVYDPDVSHITEDFFIFDTGNYNQTFSFYL